MDLSITQNVLRDKAIAYTTTYYYVVQLTYQSWTTTSNQASATTGNSHCR